MRGNPTQHSFRAWSRPASTSGEVEQRQSPLIGKKDIESSKRNHRVGDESRPWYDQEVY